MSRLHLLILWVLTLIAGAIVFSSRDSKHQSAESTTKFSQGDKVFELKNLSSSSGLKYTADGNTVSILLKNKKWVVSEKEDYPADDKQLGSAFDAVGGLKIVQGLSAKSKHWDRFGLDDTVENPTDRPKVLTIFGENGEPSRIIYIGKNRESTGGQRGAGGGRFVRFSDDDSSVYVVEQTFDKDTFPSDPNSWLDKKLPKVEALLSISMKPADGQLQPWTASRKTAFDDLLLNDLPDGFETDKTATTPLKNLFSDSSFSELLSAEEVEKRAAKKESRAITVVTASGTTYVYTIVPEKKEDAEEGEAQNNTADSRNYIISFKFTSGPKDPEKPGPDATDAQKAGYQALVANKQLNQRKYERDKELEGRFYLVSNFVVNALLKEKTKMRKKKEAPKPEATSPPIAVPRRPNPGIPHLPGREPTNGTPKKRKRIEAVTPPIAIPPLPKKDEEKKETPPKDQ